MSFEPLTNYTGYNHVPEAGAVWIHPKNGNAYCCACEKDSANKQDLTVYRKRPGTTVWEVCKRYDGGVASENQVTMGGAAIEQDGSLTVVTSLIIPGAPYVTKEKFQGCSINEPLIDEPWAYGGEKGEKGDPGPPGAGGVTRLPRIAISSAWDAHVLTSGVLIDIPSTFNVPVAQLYLVRFCATAPAANVIARAGTQDDPFFLTAPTQAPNVRYDTQGFIPGPEAWISPAQGTPTVWLQILAYS